MWSEGTLDHPVVSLLPANCWMFELLNMLISACHGIPLTVACAAHDDQSITALR